MVYKNSDPNRPNERKEESSLGRTKYYEFRGGGS